MYNVFVVEFNRLVKFWKELIGYEIYWNFRFWFFVQIGLDILNVSEDKLS